MLSKPIYNITPFTLLDYPDKSACIIWYSGCNMRCLYCYNPEIVLGKGSTSFPEAISFLQKRQGLLDAVVFSGGECLLHKNIVAQIKEIKEMGFLVKIDTNGSNTAVLKQLLQESLIDYVALDYKATASKFQTVTKTDLFSKFENSFAMLQESEIPFEIRTTFHSDLILEADWIEMIEYLTQKNYTGKYYIQSFKNNVETLGKLPSSAKMKEQECFSSLIFQVFFRN